MADDVPRRGNDLKHIERSFAKAVREGKFAVVLKVVRKPRWKWDGHVLPESQPKHIVYIEVADFRLLPTDVAGAIFLISRAEKTVTSSSAEIVRKYLRVATPMEYLSLPAVDNDGSRATIGLSQEYLAANLVQAFDKPDDATAFISTVLADIQRFLRELYEFEQRNKEALGSRLRATYCVTHNQLESVN